MADSQPKSNSNDEVARGDPSSPSSSGEGLSTGYKIKAGLFLGLSAGLGLLFGFGGALAQAKKQGAQLFLAFPVVRREVPRRRGCFDQFDVTAMSVALHDV